MSTEKCRSFILQVGFAAILVGFLFLFFDYLLPLFMPFFLAFVLTAVLKPAIEFLSKKLRLNRRLTATVLVTLAFIILAFLCLLVGTQLVDFAKTAVSRYNTRIVPAFEAMYKALSRWADQLDPNLMSSLEGFGSSFISSLRVKIAELSTKLLTATVSGLPTFLLQVVFTVIATYFMSLDYGVIRRGVANRMKAELFAKIQASYSYFKKTIGKFLRSYFLIFLITFGELSLGLCLCRVESFYLIALLIAIFDILPVVGSGMVMLPWSLLTLIRGDVGQGLGLLAVYLFVVVARQFLEPAIVGETVGMHPLLTLVAMYTGLKLFGGAGLWGVPILCAMLLGLEKDGVINFLPKREVPLPPEEAPPKRKWFQKKGKAAK